MPMMSAAVAAGIKIIPAVVKMKRTYRLYREQSANIQAINEYRNSNGAIPHSSRKALSLGFSSNIRDTTFSGIPHSLMRRSTSRL